MASSLKSEADSSKGEVGTQPPKQHLGRIRMRSNYAALAGVSCLIVFFAWSFNDKFEAIRRLWPVLLDGREPPEQVAGWHDPGVNITLLTTAVEFGAVCLDGSSPAYYLSRGVGNGVNNWIISMEGGSYCDSIDSCLSRSFQELGSSKYMPPKMHFTGILSNSPIVNPDFHNWNRVFVKYCDGSSYYSDVADPVDAYLKFRIQSGRIFYRGRRIWSSIMNDLLSKGMNKAEKAFLTGCSAGGIASVLHCDRFRNLLPRPTTTVKCLSDGGFIVNVPDVYGEQTVRGFISRVARTHNLAASLPERSTSKMSDETLALFEEYHVADVKTPLFVLNSAYDNWQIANSLLPYWSDAEGAWARCRANLSLCTEAQLKTVHKFRADFLERLRPLLDQEKNGAFIDSCHLHCQSQDDILWNGPKVDGKSVSTVVGDWFFERNTSSVIDGPFPCNPTCPASSGLGTVSVPVVKLR